MTYKPTIFRAIIFIMALNVLRAQENFLGHTIRFTPMDRPFRELKEDEYRLKLLTRYQPLFDKTEWLNEFVDQMVNHKIRFLYSNQEYENMAETEMYLEELCSRIGLEKQLNSKIRVKIVRDPSLNAYIYEDGVIYVHIGLLARLNSEAEIAAVLAHEMGHLASQHACKDFIARKKFLRNQGTISTFASGMITGMIATSINANNLSDQLIAQEEEADDSAFKTIAASDYNYQAFERIFTRFTELETKYKNKADYHKSYSLFYIQTHPNSEKRLRAAQKVPEGKSGGRNFLVDSVFFMKMKQMATDECINLCFEQLDYDACIEMAFVQHLRRPDDQFYLFYLTECTRRLLASDPVYEDLFFISGLYEDAFCRKSNDFKPLLVYTEGKFIAPGKYVKNSIFNKLEGPLLEMSARDVAALPGQPLLQKDTLRLLTYKDAHRYFVARSSDLGYNLNIYDRNDFTAKTATMDSVLNGRASKYSYYKNLPSIVTEHKSTQDKNDRTLWIVAEWDFLYEKKSPFKTEYSTDGTESYNKLVAWQKEHNVPLTLRNELDFDTYNKITNYYAFVYPKLEKYKFGGMKEREVLNYPLSNAMPDLYFLMLKHKLRYLVFSSIQVRIGETTGISSQLSNTWTVNNYIFDAKNNRIRTHSGFILYQETMFGKNKESNEEHYFRTLMSALDIPKTDQPTR